MRISKIEKKNDIAVKKLKLIRKYGSLEVNAEVFSGQRTMFLLYFSFTHQQSSTKPRRECFAFVATQSME